MGEGSRVGRTAGAISAVLLLAGLLAGCGGDEPDAEGGLHGATHEPYQVLATPLTDTDGEPFSLVDDTDKPLTLVFFGYTSCPDVCQLVMASLAQAMNRLDDADRERVDVVFVTTDPKQDTPEVLRDYLDRFDPDFIGLTGELETIAAIGKPLAVYVDEGEKLPSGGRDLDAHSTHVTAIDDTDRAPLLWSQDTTSAEFADDIHTLLADAG
ncbi:SCO family protein [Nocardioides ferulae]|uniref:SCO family protein n=1 Tax=Nocardioides ferulae TaxID=2340821 RepID=UPI000EB536F6|nr:SCO family protein [Nocardioides ferulae]